MHLDHLRRVYFIGIGGIGMSALARFFLHLGKQVAGYDRTKTALTALLEKEGMNIHYQDDLQLIPEEFRMKDHRLNTLVVYTPAVPSRQAELIWFREQGYEVMKRAEVLGLITRAYEGIAVAGSHGKSTLSSMIATVMDQSTIGCSAFLGAICKNFDSNLVLSDSSRWAVMEADEFDRSFLHLEPAMAIVTSMDPDHLDIYGGADHLRISFEEFLAKVKTGSEVVIKYGLSLQAPASRMLKISTYGFNEEADIHPFNIRRDGLGYTFDLVSPMGIIKELSLTVPGWINVENAAGAAAMCLMAGVTPDEIRQGLKSFQGVKRRFDIRFHQADRIYIDDYAHHPKEISAFISSLRKMFPDGRIVGVFQPHLFSRTRDFAKEFAEELSRLDELLLMDIYPAREEPIEGVSSHLILKDVKDIKATMADSQAILRRIREGDWDVLATIGAGNIDLMVQPIEDLLHEMVR